MSASPAASVAEPGLIVLLVAALAIRAWFAGSDAPPGLVPSREAEAWMADCLPGVGAKHLHGALDALRRSEIQALPKEARASARSWFILVDETGAP